MGLRYLLRLLNWWGTRKFSNWRVVHLSDGLWYVEEEHLDQGWVTYPDSASKLRRDAVAWAHRYYAKPSHARGNTHEGNTHGLMRTTTSKDRSK